MTITDKERFKVHLVSFEGVTPKEADDFLDVMAIAGKDDPDGYADFLAQMQERMRLASPIVQARGDVRNARSALEAVIRAASGRATSARVKEIQGKLRST